MARVIGGIGTSHVPTIGLAYDRGRQSDPAWAPLFKGYEPAAAWLAEQRPDVLVVFYNDHATTLFFDLYPTFAMAIGESFPIADEGAGRRALPDIPGHVKLQAHIGDCLLNDEFDLAFIQGKPLDHGVAAPLPLLWPHEPGWPGKIVPILVNVLQYPLPTPRRCFRLGQALRRAIESYPEDLRVAVVGTGGLSHQVHGERTGFNDTDWDTEFLDLLRDRPEVLTQLRHVDFARRGGAESVEQVMWLAMRGALGSRVRELHRNVYLATTTAMAVAVYEEVDTVALRTAEKTGAKPASPHASNPQLEGIESLEGTYVFDVETANRTLAFNRFFWNMIEEEHRRAFTDDEEAAMAEAGLTETERALVRARDWLGIVRYGVNFFALEKWARVLRVSNISVYAEMRGESLDAFLATRRVPAAS